ncbi:Dot/Icm T4SS effector AnkI/LegAS4 [uncultured Legionella sp.]|uniref:Dot/Icm T4SS effector AnkI/LegAS4 n=1 Tax=uncultured Legionella sp. TaxID=210934 RepID=UPI002618FF95|nr:Dot/Icm T4SS effector AnkI/LegAS4 [uncultured Legionella sp.]
MSKAKTDRNLQTTPLKNVGIFKEGARRSTRQNNSIYSQSGLAKKDISQFKPKTLSGDLFLHKSDRPTSTKDKRMHLARIRKSMKSLAIDNMVAEDYIPSSLDQIDLVSVKSVNLLSNFDGRGLFASEDIPAGTCIALYTGEIYSSIAEFNRFLATNSEADKSYAMTIAGRIVDAAKKGNFSRYINFSDSQDNAVFEEGMLDRRKVVKVITIKDIKMGQQLLINYNIYEERASKSYFFLNPSDGALSAYEFYEMNLRHYEIQSVEVNLPALNLVVNQQCLLTPAAIAVLDNILLSDIEHLDFESIDLPVLNLNAYQEVLDFNETDVFTPLMAACYLGQVNNVQWLITHGANVDQQQNQSGNCPLFLALEGYNMVRQNNSNYIKLLALLIRNQANPAVHDRADRTFLHKTSTVLSDEHFAQIIKLLNQTNAKQFITLFTYAEENGFDLVTYCLKNKAFNKMILLLKEYPEYFTKNYEGEEQRLNGVNIDAFKLAIKDYSLDDQEHLYQLLELHDVKMSSGLLVILGLSSATAATMTY